MTTHVKYPRTYHLPYSPGVSDDDLKHSRSPMEGKYVIVTEKMDGENTTMYSDGIHARSLDSRHHPSRDWVKNFHNTIRYMIPDGMRICGENLYARHSIEYTNLSSYFYGFSVWKDDLCLSWEETVEVLTQLGIQFPTILYTGIWDDDIGRKIAASLDLTSTEGFVVRVADAFTYADFGRCVAKWVRKNHVTTDVHWMNATIIPNKLC